MTNLDRPSLADSIGVDWQAHKRPSPDTRIRHSQDAEVLATTDAIVTTWGARAHGINPRPWDKHGIDSAPAPAREHSGLAAVLAVLALVVVIGSLIALAVWPNL